MTLASLLGRPLAVAPACAAWAHAQPTPPHLPHLPLPISSPAQSPNPNPVPPLHGRSDPVICAALHMHYHTHIQEADRKTTQAALPNSGSKLTKLLPWQSMFDGGQLVKLPNLPGVRSDQAGPPKAHSAALFAFKCLEWLGLLRNMAPPGITCVPSLSVISAQWIGWEFCLRPCGLDRVSPPAEWTRSRQTRAPRRDDGPKWVHGGGGPTTTIDDTIACVSRFRLFLFQPFSDLCNNHQTIHHTHSITPPPQPPTPPLPMSAQDPDPYAARPAPASFDEFMAHIDAAQAQQGGGGLLVDADLYEELFGELPTG